MKTIIFIYLLFFSPSRIQGSETPFKKSVSSNVAFFQEQEDTEKYINEYENLKKFFVNKYSLINGQNVKNHPKSDKAILFLWTEAIEKFIEHDFKNSISSIEKIIKADNFQYKNVCYLLILNKLYSNNLEKIQTDFTYCKELNLKNNNFSLFILETIIDRKLAVRNEKMDRFLYENGQSFDDISAIISYLKIALVFNEHNKIQNLLPNLPPNAYENKTIRELMAFVYFRLRKKEKAKEFLQNINSVNSNNLLATILIGEDKYNLALARLLVSQKIEKFSETTIDRLIALTIISRNFENGVDYINTKKFFLESFNNDITYEEYKLLSIYFNIKKKNYTKAYSILKNYETDTKKNLPDIVLTMGSFLGSVTATRTGDEKDFLYHSCRRKNALSCFFLQTITYFPELDYFAKEFNANTFKLDHTLDQLKSEVSFSPIKEEVFINQKYIQELDTLDTLDTQNN